MTRKKKQQHRHAGLGDRVQWYSNIPNPDLPGFNKTLRGEIVEVDTDGIFTVQIRKKTYRVSPKKCLRLGR